MNQSLQSTYNYLVPADGTTHEVSFSGILVSGQDYDIDWHSFVQNNFPFRPQGAKIQNPSSAPVVLANPSTGETSICPANSSRWVSFTSTAHMKQTLSGAGNVTVIFVDYPVMETAPVSSDGTPIAPSLGDTVTITGSLPAGTNTIGDVGIVGALPAGTNIIGRTGVAATLTDGSGTITTASTSQQVFAANASRAYLFIQNNSSDDLWINFTTAAVVGEPSINIAPQGAFAFEGQFIGTEAVNIIGATAGQAFTAKEG